MSVGIWWAGVPVAHQGFTAERSLGIEPDLVRVTMHADQFLSLAGSLGEPLLQRLEPGDLPDGIGRFLSGQVSTRPLLPRRRDVRGASILPGEGVQLPGGDPDTLSPASQGDLVIVEKPDTVSVSGLTQPSQVVYRNMVLHEVRVLDGSRDPMLLELSLADMRIFWLDYGHMTARFNVRLAGGGLDFSTTRAGEAWALRDILSEHVMTRLPGQPALVDFPPDLLGETPELIAWAARPADVLRGILDHYHLLLALNLDGSVSVYRPSRGNVGQVPDSQGGDNRPGHDPDTGLGIWEDSIVLDGDHYSFRSDLGAPTEITVQGMPRHYTTAIDYCTPIVQVEEPAPWGGYQEVLIEASPERLRDYVGLTREEFADVGWLLLPLFGRDLLYQGDTVETVATPTGELFEARDLAKILEDETPEEFLRRQAITEFRLNAIRSQLFRRYQLPRKFWNMLPMLERAELDDVGRPLEITFEAFGFEPYAMAVPPDLANSEEDKRRRALEQQHAKLIGEIARLDLEIKRRKGADARELGQYYLDQVEGIEIPDLLGLPVFGLGDRPGEPARTEGRALGAGRFHRSADDLRARLNAPRSEPPTGEPLVDGVRGEDVATAVERWLEGNLAEAVGFEDLEGKQIEELERERNARAEEARKLAREINPAAAIQEELTRARAEREIREDNSGAIDTEGRASEARLAAELKAAKLAAGQAQNKQPQIRVFHANRARRKVRGRILDARRGIFELEEPAGWLSRPFDNAGPFWPLPVRVTFGTVDLPSPERVITQPAFQSGPWDRITAGLISRSPEVLSALFQGLGHLLPSPIDTPQDIPDNLFDPLRRLQTRFDFNKQDTASGLAAVTDQAFLISDPSLQERIGLPTNERPDGSSNREELLSRVRPIAQAILDLDSAAESGYLDVEGARPVNCNGRVTGVRHELAGSRVITRVSFDQPTTPLDEVLKSGRADTSTGLRFGLDVEGFLEGLIV